MDDIAIAEAMKMVMNKTRVENLATDFRDVWLELVKQYIRSSFLCLLVCYVYSIACHPLMAEVRVYRQRMQSAFQDVSSRSDDRRGSMLEETELRHELLLAFRISRRRVIRQKGNRILPRNIELTN